MVSANSKETRCNLFKNAEVATYSDNQQPFLAGAKKKKKKKQCTPGEFCKPLLIGGAETSALSVAFFF